MFEHLMSWLQCQSVSVLLEPLVNETETNMSEHDELRINTCFEHGILQPSMFLLLFLLAFFQCLCSCKSRKTKGRRGTTANNNNSPASTSPRSPFSPVSPVKGGVKGDDVDDTDDDVDDGVLNLDDQPPFQCSFATPLVLTILITIVSLSLLIVDFNLLPSPGFVFPSTRVIHGKNVSVHDGTAGPTYLFVGDFAELGNALLLAAISVGIVRNGKTPVATALWVFIQTVFLAVEARLPVKALLIQFCDAQSSFVADLLDGTPWESVVELDLESQTGSLLRVIRVGLFLILAAVLMTRRERPKSQFDPQNFMPNPSSEGDDKGETNETSETPTPPTPATASYMTADTSGLHYSKRFSNEHGGSICTRLMFGFVNPLLAAGGRAALEMKQLFLIGGEDDAVTNARRLQRIWRRVGMKKKNSLIKSMLKLYGKELVSSGLLMLLSITCTLLQPQVLFQLLTFIQQDEVENTLPYWWGYVFAFIGALCIFLQQLAMSQAQWILSRVGYRMRGAVTILLFEKSLRLSQPEMSAIGIGKIVNLAEVDAMKLMWSMYIVHSTWSLPLTLLIGLMQLFFLISWGALSGIGVMLLLFVPNYFFMKKGVGLIAFIFSLRDRRVKLLTEHITGIRLIKMLGWEREKMAEVNQRRKDENDNRWWLRFWFSNIRILVTSTPAIMNITTFSIFMAIIYPAPLTAATGFTVLSLTGIIQGPAASLGQVLQLVATINISLKRLEKFLNSEETKVFALTDAVSNDEPASLTSGYYWDKAPQPDLATIEGLPPIAVSVAGGAFKWADAEEKDAKLLAKGRGGSKPPPGTKPSKNSQKRRRRRCCGSGKKAKSGLEEELLDPVQNAEDDTSNGEAAPKDDSQPEPGTNDDPKKGTPSPPTISDINIDIRRGQLVMIVGKVGSGKTTLLSSLLNEVPFAAGAVRVMGTRAFCSQVPWIQNLTVRENILMGTPYNEERYLQAINASCLGPDIDSLPAGDKTEIGERGISLSGGQKKRIAIARAVYADADVLLLDDILSAVDAHVADHIMKEGICGVLGAKTRILVTHAIHLLPQADHVIVMDKGKIVEQGSLADITSRGADLSQYIELDDSHNSAQEESKEDSDSEDGATTKTEEPDKPAKSKKTVAAGKKLVKKEERAYGSVKCNVWLRFFQNLGVNWSFIMLFSMIMSCSMDQLFSWWLTFWTDAANETASDPAYHTQQFYLAIFSTLNVTSVVMVAVKCYVRLPAGYRLSERIHFDALWGVLRAPVSYFDTTKSGRVINKFSSDLAKVDSELMFNVMVFVDAVLSGILCAVVVVLLCPVVLIIILPTLIGFYCLQRVYRASIRELQRLTSVSRSPVFSAFNEALDGASTIRCFDKQLHFANLNEARLRNNLSCYMNQTASQKWLSVRLVCLSSSVFLGVAIFSVVQKQMGWNISIIGTGAVFTSGMAGLVLQKSLEVMSVLENFITSLASAETALISMERLIGFATLEAEAPLELQPARPSNSAGLPTRASAIARANVMESDADFPVNGDVEFRDVTMAYREGLDCTLRGVSFKVPSGSSVGIVGRTGAGKSSLIVALFRLVRLDPEPADEPQVTSMTPERVETHARVPQRNSGQILIGGVDTASVGLHRLRRGLSIIPQEPELFTGTIRSNLDPWNQFTDEQIWSTLESCEMKDCVAEMGNDAEKTGLEAEVAPGGGNLSVGQRQLLCLSRAILRRAKVLVMDEATGSVDTLTDSIIQKTLSKQAKDTGCTVLTIAHRINTIINNDLIIVMDAGKVVEMGSPADLLAREDSIFRSLAHAQGLA